MTSHKPFGHLQPKLWAKEGSGIDPNPTSIGGVQHNVGKLSKRITRLLQTSSNRRSEQEVMDAQSIGSANQDSFGTPLWESREKVTFGCRCGGVM
jgi:hypothetical protein